VVKIAKKKDETKHFLVPKHVKLTEKERNQLLDDYKVRLEDLPRISMKDPAINHMDLTPEDIIRVVRKSQTSGEAVFYRRIVK
jgi:DNA-directed RNA polymerase subunit H (RpoH/RPB5)